MQLTRIVSENYDAFDPLLGGVKINPEQLGVGAVEDGKAVGAAVFSALNETLIVDYIYVAGEYRKQGIGRALIENTHETLGTEKLLATFIDYREDLMAFFKRLGFSLAPDTDCYKLPAKEFLNSEPVKKLIKMKISCTVETVADMKYQDKYELQDNLRRFAAQEIFDENELFMPLSLVTYKQGTQDIATCMFCEKYEKEIIITLLTSFTNNVADITTLFSAFGKAVVAENLEDCELYFVSANDSVDALIHKLLPDVRPNAMMINAMR